MSALTLAQYRRLIRELAQAALEAVRDVNEKDPNVALRIRDQHVRAALGHHELVLRCENHDRVLELTTHAHNYFQAAGSVSVDSVSAVRWLLRECVIEAIAGDVGLAIGKIIVAGTKKGRSTND